MDREDKKAWATIRKIDWEYVAEEVIPPSTHKPAPRRSKWFNIFKGDFICPVCNTNLRFRKHLIEGTHYVIRYWWCPNCDYEYATRDIAIVRKGDYIGLGD